MMVKPMKEGCIGEGAQRNKVPPPPTGRHETRGSVRPPPPSVVRPERRWVMILDSGESEHENGRNGHTSRARRKGRTGTEIGKRQTSERDEERSKERSWKERGERQGEERGE
eukprot:2662755-Rhodomonas_salina.3